jgi:hypothetical protein
MADTFPELTGVQDPETPSERATRDIGSAQADRVARDLKSQTAERLARDYVEDSTGANTTFDSAVSAGSADAAKTWTGASDHGWLDR